MGKFGADCSWDTNSPGFWYFGHGGQFFVVPACSSEQYSPNVPLVCAFLGILYHVFLLWPTAGESARALPYGSFRSCVFSSFEWRYDNFCVSCADYSCVQQSNNTMSAITVLQQHVLSATYLMTCRSRHANELSLVQASKL